MSLPGATGPVAIVAIDGPARYDPGKPIPLGFSKATIDAVGSSVTLAFAGSAEGTGACTADYRLALVEHSTFVEASAVTTRDGGGMCLSIAYQRKATAKLAKPLGARVLVEGKTGAPIIVTSTTP